MISPLNMIPWLRLPASGDVWQKVTNITDWFSPKVEMNFAGDPQIEQEVNANVASYGRQIGVLTEAVIALAQADKAALDKAVTRLKEFQAEIEAIKKRRAPDLEEGVLDAMSRLKSTDKDAYERVLTKLNGQGAA